MPKAGTPYKKNTINRENFRRDLFRGQKGLCHLCKEPMTLKRGSGSKIPHEFATFDHLLPLSFGGRGNKENIALAHRRCNSNRGNSPLDPKTGLTRSPSTGD